MLNAGNSQGKNVSTTRLLGSCVDRIASIGQWDTGYMGMDAQRSGLHQKTHGRWGCTIALIIIWFGSQGFRDALTSSLYFVRTNALLVIPFRIPEE